MSTAPSAAKTTAFFQLLHQTPNLDQRDNRGKKHNIALVLSGLTCALCAGRDGSLSRLHRHMVNQFDTLCQLTGSRHARPVSRAQLPLVLAKVNSTLFAQLLFDWFGLELATLQGQWLAVDGKELRGSIQRGQNRGEACVSVITQHQQTVVCQAYYDGDKESEKPVVRQLLTANDLLGQRLTLDALHFNPLTINAINQAAGQYIIGVKANQRLLYRSCIIRCITQPSQYRYCSDWYRGHGRVEQRSYQCFSVVEAPFAPRWQQAGFRTLI